MNLKKVYELVCEECPKVEFEIQESCDDKFNMAADIVSDDYGASTIKIAIFDDGSLIVAYLFGKIDKTLENYNLINDFNNASRSYFTALIDEDEGEEERLELVYVGYESLSRTEKDMAYIVGDLISDLYDDTVANYLKPLIDATYRED